MKQILKNRKSVTARFVMLLLLPAAVTLTGCDFLVKDVPNQTSEEEWWQSRSQLNTALNNIYRVMPSGTLRYDTQDASDSQGYGYGNQRVEMEALTDNVIGSANYVFYDVFDSGSVPTNEEKSVENIWRAKWKAIRRCCRFLDNYTRANISANDKPTVDRWAAEARASRAFFHLELFMFYGEIPIVSSTLLASEQHLARRSQEDIVEWIATEFEEAAKGLPAKGDTQNGYSNSEKWRWTKGACHAWMSYMYLYVGDWANAKLWAQEVIDSGLYHLFRNSRADEQANSYANTFLEAYNTNDINDEAIFVKNQGMLQAHRRLAPRSSSGGQTGISPTASLVNEYELLDGRTLDELPDAERENYIKNPKYGPRDPRLTMSILFPRESYLGCTPDPWSGGNDAIGRAESTKTGYWVKKWSHTAEWVTNTDTSNGKNDFYLMRYAVVLLNYVEAAIELNQLSDPNIYEFLNDIRNRAGMPDVDESKYNTQEKLRELVRRERRVELAFEGHRLFDIRRWGIARDVMNGPVYGAMNPNTGELHMTKERKFNDRDYLWPIPASEMTTNANMVQNTGY